jgi:cytochrome c-type biogenesis protein CcmH/NrfF
MTPERRIPILSSVVFGLLLIAPLTGMTTGVEDLSTEQRERFERLSGELIAPCCWSETARTHRSPAADEMRNTLRLRILEDWDDEEIIGAFVAEHGDRVLAVPRGSRADALFWTPVIVSALGLAFAAAVIVALLRRKTRTIEPGPDKQLNVEVHEEDLEW